jgi:hypothetical protein
MLRFPWWLKRTPTAQVALPSQEPEIPIESYRTIADLAQKEYANENDRTKTIDGKAGALIGATGAAIAFIIGAVVKPPDVLSQRADVFAFAYYIAIAVALLLLFVAQVLFLLSARVRSEFRRVEVSAWVDFSIMNLAAWDVYARLAATYLDAIKANTDLNDRKAKLQTAGIAFLLFGVVGLLLVPGTIMVTLWVIPHGR